MKSKKKRIMLASVVVAVLFIVIIVGTAYSGFMGPWHDHGPGFRHGFNSGGFAEFVLWRLDQRVAGLNLTPAQQQDYGQMKKKLEEELRTMGKARRQLAATVHAEIDNETPHVEKIAAQVKENINRMHAGITVHIDDLVRFYNTLNEEQKETVLAGWREKMRRFHRCGYTDEDE